MSSNYSNAFLTCLVINKKMVSTDACSNKIKIPVKQRRRGKAEKSLVKFPILCQVCSQCAPRPNIPCFCTFSNRFGRKPVLFFTFFLQGSTALIQATSVSWLMFCVLNFLRGLSHNYTVSLVLGEASVPCTLIIIQKHVFLHLQTLLHLFLFRDWDAERVCQAGLHSGGPQSWFWCRLRLVATPCLFYT